MALFCSMNSKRQLILNVDKDTYQCLGFQGQPSKFHQKSKSKYVIEVNLKELPSKPKLFYKIKRQFLKNEQKFDVLFSWQAPSDEIESSSVQMYFKNKSFTCTEEKFITNSQVLHNTCVPYVDPDQPDSCLEGGGPEDFYEWMGAISCQCTFGDVDNYENHMLLPREACTVAKCSLLTLKGFFTSQMVESIFQQIRSISHNGNLTSEQQKNVLQLEPQHPWICMTMHGFVDAPVCWNRKENGFYISGVNNHSVIIFYRSPHLWSFLTQHPRNLSM
ncbi:hypothetical protein HELRODRAFT_187895 [Helobdella robusta]|uniref:Uncharacterized protein n=1 Tax=Helobdella robusta TaxID=6412 RepID=T1FPG4_HELRO|nr:hypothetical protein HELRODRAFT_187895 [Helobdella robusta]ESO12480.1 hypothetical protein HELRODRAFT_187895 [Helobdella robusta]